MTPRMTDQEVQQYLEDNGYPPHIVKGGRPGLVRRWQEFAGEVEQGYRFGLEDYRNDLDVRAILQMVGGETDPMVHAADERVRGLLTPSDQRLWESMDGDPWWDFGYPRNAAGDLRRDLE